MSHNHILYSSSDPSFSGVVASSAVMRQLAQIRSYQNADVSKQTSGLMSQLKSYELDLPKVPYRHLRSCGNGNQPETKSMKETPKEHLPSFRSKRILCYDSGAAGDTFGTPAPKRSNPDFSADSGVVVSSPAAYSVPDEDEPHRTPVVTLDSDDQKPDAKSPESITLSEDNDQVEQKDDTSHDSIEHDLECSSSHAIPFIRVLRPASHSFIIGDKDAKSPYFK